MLGKPRNSDPADPYNCSGRSLFALKVPGQGVWMARLLDVDRGGLVLDPISGTATVDVKVKYQTPASAPVAKLPVTSPVPPGGGPVPPVPPVGSPNPLPPPQPPVGGNPLPPLPVPVAHPPATSSATAVCTPSLTGLPPVCLLQAR